MQKVELVKRLVGWLGWYWVGYGLGRLGAYLLGKAKMTGWIGDQGMVISSARGYRVVQAAIRQLSRLVGSLFHNRRNIWKKSGETVATARGRAGHIAKEYGPRYEKFLDFQVGKKSMQSTLKRRI